MMLSSPNLNYSSEQFNVDLRRDVNYGIIPTQLDEYRMYDEFALDYKSKAEYLGVKYKAHNKNLEQLIYVNFELDAKIKELHAKKYGAQYINLKTIEL